MNKIIIISGPTASGKTATSIQIAKKFQAEVVNFDSLLFYRELNIGTAKPTDQEQEGVPHHFINTHSIYNPINAADYLKIAEPKINEIHAKGSPVILVGGSGFYLQALLNGMFESTTTPQDIINKSDLLYSSSGIEPFRDILREHDTLAYDQYHPNDHYRIRRAVEHFWTTNTPFSLKRTEMKDRLTNSPVKRNQWDLLHIHLDIPKEEHFEIIKQRTSHMLSHGLLDEVKNLLNSGATGNEKPMLSIGYKESVAYLRGEYQTIEDLSERISINTRRLAKSQRTWFKKSIKNHYNPIEEFDKIQNICNEFLR